MKIRSRIALVEMARHAMHEAAADFDRAVKEYFPVGIKIAWRIGGCTGKCCHGEVTGVGYQDRIKVRNSKTGKERWIRGYDLYDPDQTS
ncbi:MULTISPECIES: hypothetical protein [Rhodopseudomonas]|uniref:hypothetical protein n=1 Tax=Rhodopseudomonas TaxID=1073 RepID=UPI000A997116|nr:MULTISPECIES: hypothetical protein [Rhodopseudomonas]MDF3809275.1 hypothetical protein [Rhodopseudomonas sp. BAL398]WOK19041.1 hypothetical protein RBJ75_05850 [Rhodopseudomonas sp. BAL398]